MTSERMVSLFHRWRRYVGIKADRVKLIHNCDDLKGTQTRAHVWTEHPAPHEIECRPSLARESAHDIGMVFLHELMHVLLRRMALVVENYMATHPECKDAIGQAFLDAEEAVAEDLARRFWRIAHRRVKA